MTTITNQIAPGHEPIDGYVLEELIGRGGYGEVWRASAPGGMKKAIKFVYGNMGEKRTEQELKSLERIKGVQHPFILGLERFEAVDNQLVIVTELADGSLEDVVRQHRDRGSCGIPRATLLGYMRDVADALDYLHQLYQLQHLDIKPANLLMVGGRVKVADFGLLKDLRDIECSIVGGLTPIYAPPEVFDGKPSVHSDQYSMAVMYQELLTGTRPFTGRTIAQLATQHVHNAPNLSSLPPSDQPVVARALEKAFDRRYGSCSEFVDALSRPRGSTVADGGAGAIVDAGDTKTVGASFVAGIGEANVSDLPELDPGVGNANAIDTSHSLVIGIGGTGAQCIDELFSRMEMSAPECSPTLHTVFIDTDEPTARSLRRFEETDRRPLIRTLAIPLRTSNEYREGGMSELRSMSRRWIYNVPRSGNTEGMRPLGRLALIDHWNRVNRSLDEAIESLKVSSGSKVPNVYVVCSIAGGTASGMYLDLVHVLRSKLDDAGLEQTKILSLLATTQFEVDPAHPLALHDSLATLHEIRHFLRPGNSYPGDAHVDLPTLPAARSPLDNVYLVSGNEVAAGTQPFKTIADYLWLDATTGRDLLESARRTPDDKTDSIQQGSLRTVGIMPLSRHDILLETVLAPAATRMMLSRWLGNPADAKSNAESLVERIHERCKIDHQSLYTGAINGYAGDHDARQKRMFDFVRSMPLSSLSDSSLVTGAIKAELNQHMRLDHAESDVQSVVDTIVRELKSHLRLGRLDVISAIETVRVLSREIRQHEIRLQQSTPENRPEELPLTPNVDWTGISPDDVPVIEVACHVGGMLLDAHARQVAIARANSLCEQLDVIETNLSNAATLLAQAIRLSGASSDDNVNPWDTFSTPLARQIAPCLVDLHAKTAKPWLVNLVTRSDHISSPNSLVKIINEVALPLVEETAAKEDEMSISRSQLLDSDSIDLSQSLSHDIGTTSSISLPRISESRTDENDTSVEHTVRSVRPSLLQCGGQQRLLLVASNQNELNAYRTEIETLHDGRLTCAVLDSTVPTLIHEAQQISIDDVIARLTTLTGGQTQVSDRLLSRCDIDWSHRR